MKTRLHTLRVHEQAKLRIEDIGEHLLLKLTNMINGKYSEKQYRKIGIMDMTEALKIDNILYHMHYEIGLDLWENNN